MKLKKKILIALLIVLILAVIVVISLVIIFSKEKQTEKESEQTIEERVQELVNNSYRYYLLKEGKLNLGEAYIVLDDVKYYMVVDDWLTSIKYIDDLIVDTFTDNFSVDLYNAIFDKHDFVEMNGRVYVNLGTSTCNEEYNPNLDDFKYKIEDEDLIIQIDGIAIRTYMEDGKRKLNLPIHSCESENSEQ